MAYEAAVDPHNPAFVTVHADCPVCKARSFIRVPTEPFMEWWVNNIPVVEALPDLTDGQRQILIDGTHEECYEQLLRER